MCLKSFCKQLSPSVSRVTEVIMVVAYPLILGLPNRVEASFQGLPPKLTVRIAATLRTESSSTVVGDATHLIYEVGASEHNGEIYRVSLEQNLPEVASA
jgi:hypothetical protein